MKLEQYLTQNPKKYLIFDLDSTLAKLNIDWSTFRQELWKIVATFDEPLTKEVPNEPWKGVELTIKAVKRNGKKGKQIIDRFNIAYEHDHYSGYTPNHELLDFIRNNTHYDLFIWTGNQTNTIQDFLKKEKLAPYFKKIVTRDMVDFIKPDPQGFSQIYIPRTNKKDYLMIGDNFTDKEMAATVGIDFFLVGYFKKTLKPPLSSPF